MSYKACQHDRNFGGFDFKRIISSGQNQDVPCYHWQSRQIKEVAKKTLLMLLLVLLDLAETEPLEIVNVAMAAAGKVRSSITNATKAANCPRVDQGCI